MNELITIKDIEVQVKRILCPEAIHVDTSAQTEELLYLHLQKAMLLLDLC